jgi:iron complex outermembrane recepter protein
MGDSVRASQITLAVIVGLGAGALCRAADQDQSPPPPAPASDHSSDKGTGLEEIIVTARKRTESLMDVPASISAISANTIAEAHMTQIDDIGALVSNLNIFEAHDNTPGVTLRGVGAFELVQGVGFYVNDVQLYEGQIVRPVDIARI